MVLGLRRWAAPADELERLRTASAAINACVWLVAGVVMVFSAVTGADLLAANGVTWGLGLAGGLAVDAALVVALIGDRQLHRYGERSMAGTVLRWTTAGMSLVLNCGQSVADRQLGATVLHALFPVLLIVLTEASQGYQLAFGRAVLARQPRRDAAVLDTATAAVPSSGTAADQPPGTDGRGAPAARQAGRGARSRTAATSRKRASAPGKTPPSKPAATSSGQQWAAAVELAASFQDSHGRPPKLGEFHTALRMQRTAASPLRRAVLAAIAEHGADTVLAQARDSTSADARAPTPESSTASGSAGADLGTAPRVVPLHRGEYPSSRSDTESAGTGE